MLKFLVAALLALVAQHAGATKVKINESPTDSSLYIDGLYDAYIDLDGYFELYDGNDLDRFYTVGELADLKIGITVSATSDHVTYKKSRLEIEKAELDPRNNLVYFFSTPYGPDPRINDLLTPVAKDWSPVDGFEFLELPKARFYSGLGWFRLLREDSSTFATGKFAGAPEPSTWAMALLGFGLAGGALRKRRSRFALHAV